MFEVLGDIASGWRTILHISEWSGLSIGTLAIGVFLFIYVPLARKAVILVAIGALISLVSVIHGDRVGSADVHAEWAEARKAAIAAPTGCWKSWRAKNRSGPPRC